MSPISFRLTHLFYRSDCYDAAPKLLRPFYDGEIFLTVCHVKCLGLPSLCFNFFFRTSLLSHCVLAALRGASSGTVVITSPSCFSKKNKSLLNVLQTMAATPCMPSLLFKILDICWPVCIRSRPREYRSNSLRPAHFKYVNDTHAGFRSISDAREIPIFICDDPFIFCSITIHNLLRAAAVSGLLPPNLLHCVLLRILLCGS